MSTLQHTLLHTFPSALKFLPLDALRHGGTLRCAGQHALYEADEKAWKYDTDGAWNGPAPIRSVPSELGIVGASEVEADPDIIHRIASGTEAIAVWGLKDAQQLADVGALGESSAFLLALMDVVTGEISTIQLPAVGALTRHSLGVLSDGKYLLCCRLVTALLKFRLPPNYTRNDALYKWGDGSEDYWDYVRNVGKLPPAGHELYAKREQVIRDGKDENTPLDADYIIDDEQQGAEWSARKFIVGNGDWSDSTHIPPCGPSLYEIVDVSTRNALPVELMTRTGNVLRKRSAGTLLLAGQRMSHSGPEAALWEYDGSAWELLATNHNPSNGMCECALSNHGPTDIREMPDGTIYVLTKCSLHRYDPNAPRISERLPGFPAKTMGHPGGQSLRIQDGKLFWTTESFGAISARTEDNQTRAQFYNYFVEQSGQNQIERPGTRFHGPNALCNWMGKLWAVMQDKPDSDASARQYITWFDGADWSFETTLEYKANGFRWQRLLALENGTGGAHPLLIWGYKTGTEQGLVGYGNGRAFRWMEFPYRIRRASLSTASTGTRNVALAIGRAADEATLYTNNWYLLESNGTLEYDSDEEPLEPPDDRDQPPPREDWGDTAGGGPEVVVVRCTAQEGRAISAIQAFESGRANIVRDYNKTTKAIWMRVNSSAAADDYDSYDTPLRYSIWEPLPFPAQTVDVLYLLPNGTMPTDVVFNVVVRN